MTVAVLSADTTVLPTALLPLAKSQMRIDWAGEDDFIRSVIARAIARFEQVNEVTINPTSVAWSPKETDFKTTGGTAEATIPVRPVSTFAAAIPPNNVTADYVAALKWDSIHGVPIQVLVGPQVGNLSVTLTVGYANLDALPPPVLDVILRAAAFLYEHRELETPGKGELALDLRSDFTWWMPRI